MSENDMEGIEPVRLGLVGLGGHARNLIDRLDDCAAVKVVAVGDLDGERVEQAAARFDAEGFADVRSLIVHPGVEAVFMSLPHHVYPEYVRLSAERGLHLLKEKPLGRSLEEALSLVDAYRRSAADKVFMLATQRRFHPGFVALRERLAEAGRPFLARSRFLFNWGGEFGWRGERAKAGFGCLGDAGYHNFDLLGWLLGTPTQVSSLQGGMGRANPGHPYDTDDTGVVLLGYDSGLIGNIVASWATAGPSVLDVWIHGTEATLHATPTTFRKLTGSGEVVDELRVEDEPMQRDTVGAMLAAFIKAVRSGRAADNPSSARENLLTQAVVEAAYLSARTGQPQSPRRVFELHGRSIEEFGPPPAEGR